MQEAKYQEIARALENGIRNGEYRGRLPSVRLLGELFGVNPRTILRALQQLTAGGLIVPNGNRGFLIPEEGSRRPVSGNIVIFYPGPVSGNPGQLDRLIAQTGMRPISISTPAADLCGVRSFWETLSADGVIFMNSSLDRESAYQLKLSGIPFVAANRMPCEWGVNCVEFDHENALRLFLKALIRRGRRRIALLNPRYPLRYFREIIFSTYFEVMNAYAIFDPELFVYPDESQPYEAALAAGVERLLALPRPPDAIYSSLPEPELRRILAAHRVTLPKAVECGFSRIFEEPAPDGGEPGLVYRYDRLRESLWELLQLVIAAPVRTPETRLIPVPAIGPDGELLTAATNSQPRN